LNFTKNKDIYIIWDDLKKKKRIKKLK
jgi:hypothetical protein